MKIKGSQKYNIKQKESFCYVLCMEKLILKWKHEIFLKIDQLREAFKKKNKKNCNKCYIGSDPPPIVTKNTMYFFPKLDHFGKKIFR